MRKHRIKSYCKINISLRVIKKMKNGLHKINSFVAFAKIYDQLYIQENKNKKDIIKFYGLFGRGISRTNNTITKTLNILRQNNYIKENYFIIKIKKNIPKKSGLGGGSMNAVSLLLFLIRKYNLNINHKLLLNLASKVGSDVVLGIKLKNTFFNDKTISFKRFKNTPNFYLLIVKPNLNCSTKLIYSKNRQFSKKYKNVNINKINKLVEFFRSEVNDLEKVAFRIYPKIKRLIKYLNDQKNCEFSRMTGSGSACVGYFTKLQFAKKALINVKKKFPKYWCKLSKAM